MIADIDKTTLGLHLPTDPRWIEAATLSIEEILIDHAWCEQKAASTGISLIVQFGEREKLVEVLTPIVAEEWAHFRMVLREMEKRNIKLGHKRVDTYVVELLKLERKGDKIERQLMDKLLLSALIEARSAEKFKILSKNISDESLRDFYHELMVSEAGHYRTFIDLAKEYMPENVVDARWKELLTLEADIIKNIGVRQGQFH
jgi:tRNA-(ms[2]io[6]A)-hydroxylase